MNEPAAPHEYQLNGICKWCSGTRETNARSPDNCEIRANFIRASNDPTSKVAAWVVTLDTSLREVLQTMNSRHMNYVHFAVGPFSVAMVINPVSRTEQFKDVVARFQRGQ